MFKFIKIFENFLSFNDFLNPVKDTISKPFFCASCAALIIFFDVPEQLKALKDHLFGRNFLFAH